MASEAVLALRIILNDSASAGLGSLNTHMLGLGTGSRGLLGRISHLSDGMKALGITALASGIVFGGLATFVAKSTKAASEFQTSLLQLKQSVDGARENIKPLAQLIVDLGAKTIYSSQQITDAFVKIGVHGFDAKAILAGIGEQSVLLAQAMGQDGATDAASLLSSALQMFGGSAQDAQGYANDLLFAFRHGVNSISDLTTALQQSGAQAALMKVPFADFTAALGFLGEAGLSGSKAGTALRYMLASLADPTSKAQKELTDLGLLVINSATPAFKDFAGQLDAAAAAAGKTPAAFDGTLTSLSKMFDQAKKLGTVHTDETLFQWAQKAGILKDQLYNADGTFIGVSATIEKLGKSLAGLPDNERLAAIQQMFNVRAGMGAEEMLKNYPQAMALLNQFITQEKNGTSVTKDAADKYNTLAGSLGGVKTRFKDVEVAAGSSNLGPMTGLLHKLNDAMGHLFSVAADGTPKLNGAGNQVILLGTAASGAIFGISSLTFLGRSLGPAFKGAGHGFREMLGPLNDVLDATPRTSAFGRSMGEDLAIRLRFPRLALEELHGSFTRLTGPTFNAVRGGIRGVGDGMGFLSGRLGDLGMVLRDDPFGKLSQHLTHLHATAITHSPFELLKMGATGLKGGLGSLTSGLGSLGTGAMGLMKGGLGSLTSGLGSLGSSALGLLPELGAVAGAAAPIIAGVLAVVGVITVLVLLFTKYKKEGMQLVGFFRDVFGPIFTSVINYVKVVIGQLGAEWKKVEPQVHQALTKMVAAIINARPFFELLGRVIGTVVSIIVGILGGLIKAFISVLPSIINVFTGIFNVIGGIAKLVMAIFHGEWGKIPGIIGGIFGSVLGIIKNLLGAVLGFVLNGAKNIVNNVLGAFNFMGKGVDQAHKDLQNKQLQHELKMKQIQNDSLIKTAQTRVQHDADRIKQLVAQLKNETDPVKRHQLEMQIGAYKHDELMTAQSITIAERRKRALQAEQDKLREQQARGWQGMLGDMMGNLGDMVGKGVGKLGELKDGIMKKLGEIGPALGDLGKHILQGLLNGLMTSLSGWLKNVPFGDQILKKIKDEFGIQSPSKKTMEIGQQVATGLLIGITGVDVATPTASHFSKLLPATSSALTGRLSAVTSPSMQRLTGAVPTGGETHIHLHVGSREVATAVLDNVTHDLQMNGLSNYSR